MFAVIPYERSRLDGVLTLCTAEGWLSFASDPDRAHRALSAPGVTTAVALAEDGDEIVGFAQLLSDGAIQAYLANLLVAPRRRGEGVGRSLLAEVLGRAGGERVSLLSEEGAVGFYEALTHQRKPGYRIYPPFTSAPSDNAQRE